MGDKKQDFLISGNNKGFTLVELIVVIVILAILATIAFLSFSSQSASARDSKRLSDISNITKGLGVYSASVGKYPLPDKYITVTASGTIISYQGYAGTNTLGIIRMSDSGKDPTGGDYYTYSTNSTQNKSEILGFLENGNNSNLSLTTPLLWENGNADSSYSGRYVMTRGDQVGVLLASGSMTPLQVNYSSSFTGIDLSNYNNGVIAYFDNNNAVSGTGMNLITAAISIGNQIHSLDPSLVLYWDMETLNGSGAIKDLGNRGNNGTISGTTLMQGKSGRGRSFDGNIDYVEADDSQSLNLSGAITVEAWVNPKEYLNSWDNNIINKDWNSFRLMINNTGRASFWLYMSDGIQIQVNGNNIPLNEWSHLVGTYSSTTKQAKIYVNGILKNTINVSGSAYVNSNTAKFCVGQYRLGSGEKFSGKIDEIYIYNRELSANEVKLKYDNSK